MPDLDAFSYVPDATPPDEEQRRKNALLGLPMSPAKPPMLGALPPDPVKLMGADNGPYREPDSGLVRRGAGAAFDPQAEYEHQVQMGPPTPVAAEKRPFWKTALGALGEGMLGGPAAARDWFNKPQADADAANKAALGDYTARIGQLGGLASEQSESELRKAQAVKDRADAEKALRETPDKAPITVETGTGQRMQYNPATNRYDIPVGAPKPETEGKPTDEDKAVTDWIASRNLENNAANRDKARKALKLETQRPIPEPGNYQPVTDASGNTVGWVDPKSGKSRAVSSIPGVAEMVGGASSIPRKPTGQEESRLAQAGVVQRAGDDLIGQIQQNKGKVGNMGAIINSAFLGTPLSDPVSAGLAAQIASFAALNPAMHGFRGTDALKQFEKIIGGIPNNPDSMIAAIKGIQRTAGAFNPGGGKSDFSVVAPNGKTYTFSDKKSLDDFKKEAGIK